MRPTRAIAALVALVALPAASCADILGYRETVRGDPSTGGTGGIGGSAGAGSATSTGGDGGTVSTSDPGGMGGTGGAGGKTTGLGGDGGAGGGGGTGGYCGDGVAQSALNEECDDGGTSDDDNCSKDCKKQRVVEVVGSERQTCALLSGARVKCWGRNDFGQLGLGDTMSRGDGPGEMGAQLPAVDLGSGKKALALAAGYLHTCALLDDGTVKCWGANGSGQLGLGDTLTRGDESNEMGDFLPAVDLGAGKKAKAVAAGASYTCALLTDNRLKCWGRNEYGQLGQGNTAFLGDQPNEMGDFLPAVDLGRGLDVSVVSIISQHTCVLLTGNVIKCWGHNGSGRLGLGDTAHRGDGPSEMGLSLPAVDVGVVAFPTKLTVGLDHTCAVLSNSNVRCWGSSIVGQLGQGNGQTLGDQPGEMGDALPAVDIGKPVLSLACGNQGCCAQLNDSTIKCWGSNTFGTLGLGDKVHRGDDANEMGANLPTVDVGTGEQVVGIRAMAQHRCALIDDGRIKCWGWNADGQLGLGDTANRGDDPNEMGDSLPSVRLFTDNW